MSNSAIPPVSTLLEMTSSTADPPSSDRRSSGDSDDPSGSKNPNSPTPAKNPNGSASRRGPWSPEEDHKLMELISVFGPTNWVRISNNLGTRTPKQCRERYHQNLKPSLNRTPITPEEGELIEQLVAKYGKKWAEIARHLNGRSDNSIKNWWNGGASKRRRASIQHDSMMGNPAKDDKNVHTKDPRPLPLPQLGPGGSHGGPSIAQIPTQPPANAPAPMPYPGQIAFNTSMFATPNSKPMVNDPQRMDGPVPFFHGSRSASLDYSNSQLPPVLSAKRRLIDEHPPSRRHSTATVGSSIFPYNGSNSTLASGNQSPYYPNHSPLLLSNPNSRHNSISMFEFSSLNNTSQNNSSTTSRRSSIAPDFFPNPLKDHKHLLSAGTTKLQGLSGGINELPETNHSPTQPTFNLTKSSSNLSNHVFMASHKKDHPGTHNNNSATNTTETKISVSSLID